MPHRISSHIGLAVRADNQHEKRASFFFFLSSLWLENDKEEKKGGKKKHSGPGGAESPFLNTAEDYLAFMS